MQSNNKKIMTADGWRGQQTAYEYLRVWGTNCPSVSDDLSSSEREAERSNIWGLMLERNISRHDVALSYLLTYQKGQGTHSKSSRDTSNILNRDIWTPFFRRLLLLCHVYFCHILNQTWMVAWYLVPIGLQRRLLRLGLTMLSPEACSRSTHDGTTIFHQ